MLYSFGFLDKIAMRTEVSVEAELGRKRRFATNASKAISLGFGRVLSIFRAQGDTVAFFLRPEQSSSRSVIPNRREQRHVGNRGFRRGTRDSFSTVVKSR